jgi:hypothetical protein
MQDVSESNPAAWGGQGGGGGQAPRQCRVGGCGDHLRHARLALAPDLRHRVQDGGPPRRLWLLQGRHTRCRQERAPACKESDAR